MNDSVSRVLAQVVDRMRERVLEDPTVRAFWIEGGEAEDLRRPYRRLDLRLGVQDPDFEALASRVDSLLQSAGLEVTCEKEPVDLDGLRVRVRLESGVSFELWIERMSLVGKRSRRCVLPLIDKTGQFRQVLDIRG